MPHNAIPRHAVVEQRLLELAEYAETTELNSVEMGDTRVGFVTSGAAYGSAKEAFPQASFLKMGMTCPLPRRLIADFRAKVDKLYVVEELDPFLEENIRLQGVQVDGGKDILPLCGEFNPGLVARLLSDAGVPGVDEGLLVDVPDAVDGPARPAADTLPRLLAPRRVRRAAPPARLRQRRHRLLQPRRAAAVRSHALQHLHGRRHQHGARHVQGHRRERRPQEPSRGDHRRQHVLPHRHQLPARRRLQPEQRRHGHPGQPHHGHDRRPGEPEHGQDPAGQGRTAGGHPGPRPRARHHAGARDRPLRRRSSARRCSRRRSRRTSRPSSSPPLRACSSTGSTATPTRSTPTSAPAARSACAPAAPPSACTRTRTASRGSRSTPSSCTGCGVCAQLCRYEAIIAPVTDDGKDAR